MLYVIYPSADDWYITILKNEIKKLDVSDEIKRTNQTRPCEFK
jgi:hypothetical protein